MHFSKTLRMLVLLPAFAITMAAFGQSVVNYQLITACGGRYEFTPPFTDFATLQITKPFGGETTLIDSIYVESVQCILKHGNHIYLAAGDSILQYNLQTLNRIQQVYLPGANKIAANDNVLVVSRQFPVTSGFACILDATTLDLILEVSEVSGETAGVLIEGNTAYIAVNGGWAGTTGKIASITLDPPAFEAEYDLGTEATGIFDLFYLDGKILTVNKTPWGGTSGTISLFDPSNQTVNHHTLNHVVGNGYGVYQGNLFLNLDGNLGLLDTETFAVTNPVFIENPAAGVFGSIASAAVDTLNGNIYLNTTDYFSFGQGYIFNAAGDSAGAFNSGISPDALIIDYRDATPGPAAITTTLSIYPNPATQFIKVNSTEAIYAVEIYTASGVKTIQINPGNQSELTIDVSHYKPGIYILKAYTRDSCLTKKIIKH